MTQMDVSKLVGVSNVQISYYEKGEQKPGPEVLEKLAKIFNTKVDFLLNGAPPNALQQVLADIEGLPDEDKEFLINMAKKLIRVYLSVFLTSTDGKIC